VTQAGSSGRDAGVVAGLVAIWVTEAELGIDPDEMASPSHAAPASPVSYAVGALLPLHSDHSASRANR